MPKWDGLKPLPDLVLAPLLRALACIRVLAFRSGFRRGKVRCNRPSSSVTKSSEPSGRPVVSAARRRASAISSGSVSMRAVSCQAVQGQARRTRVRRFARGDARAGWTTRNPAAVAPAASAPVERNVASREHSGARRRARRRRSVPEIDARSSADGRSPPIKSGAGYAGVLAVCLADGAGKAVRGRRHQDAVHVVRHQATGLSTLRTLCGNARRGDRDGVRRRRPRRRPARDDCPAASHDAGGQARSSEQGATRTWIGQGPRAPRTRVICKVSPQFRREGTAAPRARTSQAAVIKCDSLPLMELASVVNGSND